jgi:hypothetical protein
MWMMLSPVDVRGSHDTRAELYVLMLLSSVSIWSVFDVAFCVKRRSFQCIMIKSTNRRKIMNRIDAVSDITAKGEESF